MRIIVDLLLLTPAVLYQSTLAAHFSVRGVGLDLVAILLASLSIAQGWIYGAVGGLICGLVLDGVFGAMGYWSLQYLLVGMVVGLANERLHRPSWVVSGLTVLIACLIRELVPVAYLYLVSADVGWGYALIKALVQSALCAAAFLPVHWLIQRLHRWDVISAPSFRFHGRKW